MKRFEMALFDHQRFAMLFQIEANFSDCCRIAEQKSICNHFIEIEEFDRFQGTPYFFPAARKIRSIQNIYQSPLETSDPDFQTGTINSDNAKIFFSCTTERLGQFDTTDYMGAKNDGGNRARR